MIEVTRRALLLLGAVAAMATAGCDDYCEKLQKKVCDDLKDKDRCELIRDKQRREMLSQEACEHMLKALSR